MFRRAWRRVLTGAGAAAVLIAAPGLGHADPAMPVAVSADARKQPMRFSWHTRGAGTPGVVFAVGSVTGDTPAAFERLASAHDLRGATMVLNSVGGSVLDTLTLGRRWRELGIATTVGTAARTDGAARAGAGGAVGIRPDAACESMCAFLLLAGTSRDVPPGARVRVHQIWLGDRVGDAREASYSAQDMTIVQRDVGRLAQYTFEMGGSGALLSIALSVPPWEPLHELSPDELVAARLVTRDGGAIAATGRAAPKPVQDRFAVSGGRVPAAGPARLGDAAPAAAEAAATGGVARSRPAAVQ